MVHCVQLYNRLYTRRQPKQKINATSACFTSTVSTRLFTTCPTDIMSVFQTVRSDPSDGPVWPLRRPGRLLFQPISSDGVRDVRQITTQWR